MTINLDEDHIVAQWGRRLPNGHVDWQTEDVWTPAWSTQDGRDNERAEYRRNLESLGIDPDNQPTLVFLARTKTVTYSDALTIDDESIQ